MSASVIVQHQSVGYADKSAAITAGGTSEEADAANPGRRGFYVQNISDTVMYLNFGAAAAAAAATDAAAVLPAAAALLPAAADGG